MFLLDAIIDYITLRFAKMRHTLRHLRCADAFAMPPPPAALLFAIISLSFTIIVGELISLQSPRDAMLLLTALPPFTIFCHCCRHARSLITLAAAAERLLPMPLAVIAYVYAISCLILRAADIAAMPLRQRLLFALRYVCCLPAAVDSCLPI